jgi:hypothetical protein
MAAWYHVLQHPLIRATERQILFKLKGGHGHDDD